MIKLKNLEVFNSTYKKFIKADIYIKDDLIYYIDYFNKPLNIECDEIDFDGKKASAGFIDIHMHIESSMLSTNYFCNHILANGVTSIVAEPHEIANVFGLKGIKAMIKNDTECDVFFAIPSSVPSTNEYLEGNGANINCEEMIKMYEEKNALCVGEIMNYTQIIKDDNNLEISKFLKFLKEKDPFYVIEGHCPRLKDIDLAKFIYLGINADHTEHNLEELEHRYLLGMFIELQGKMLKEENFNYIKKHNLYENTCFVTDDVMCDELYEKGHLDYVLKQAIKKGFGVENTLYCASTTPARRMKLSDRGELSVGKKADIVIFDDVNEFKINCVYKNGKRVERKEHFKDNFSDEFKNSLDLAEYNLDEIFTLSFDAKQILAKVLLVSDNTTQIRMKEEVLHTENGILNTENLLGVCFNRYGKNSYARALFNGNCIKKGAIASTWMHDSHNLFVLGKNKEDMKIAYNTLKKCGGGIVAVLDGKVLALLELEIAGILSSDNVENTALKLKKVREAFKQLGYEHYNEIMSFGTLNLVCSPFYKLSDKGLVDVSNACFTKAFEIIS